MTGRDGCQPSNDSKSGSLPAPVKDYAAEQLWKEIVALVNDTPSEIQYCVWRGPLRSGSTLDGARTEIAKCQREKQVWDLIDKTPSEVRSCVLKESYPDKWTQDAAIAKISRCQREINITNGVFFVFAGILLIAGIVFLILLLRFRAGIAASLYNLFVGCLALRLRFNRSRKQFLDNAIKEAENRLG